jgi:hypothetical protein
MRDYRRYTIGLAAAVLAFTAACGGTFEPPADATGQGPVLASLGPLTFGPDGTLFAADTPNASILALDLGEQAGSDTEGATSVRALDQKVADMLGTEANEVRITDLAVHPRSHNAFVAVMRGRGAAATPALLRVDGAGKIDVVSLDSMKFARVGLPNAPGRRSQRVDSITDMALVGDRLWIAGLSNEEFSSKLRSIPYPFRSAADTGTSVEIFHGNHGRWETAAPVNTFIPYTINNEPHLIAGYLCTPLVTFSIANLKPGEKVRGNTIAELGNMNRPLDMVAYTKGGADFLLMSNNSRGVMKIAADRIATAQPIGTPVLDDQRAGVGYQTVAALSGTEELDLLDSQQAIALVRQRSGELNLQVMALP